MKVHLLCRGGDEDVKGGAPKYFLALMGGGSESSRYTEGGGAGALNFSKF